MRSRELRERADEEMEPLALDQAADEQQLATARERGAETADVDAVGNDVDHGGGRAQERAPAELAADRDDARRPVPDPARDVPHEQRVEQAQPWIVTRHVRAAQRHDVGNARTQLIADDPGGPAGPAMADIVTLDRDEPPRMEKTANRPSRQLTRAPVVQVALRDWQTVHDDPLADPIAAHVRPRAAGHQIDGDVGVGGEGIEQPGAGEARSASERRELVVDHQNLQSTPPPTAALTMPSCQRN